MADTKTLPIKRFASSAAWDAWLQEHHTRSPGVWLEFAKKGRQSPPLSHAQALETALCYGWIDGQTASSNAGWWRQRFTPRGPRSKWSKINCAAVDRLRAQRRLTPAGQARVEAAKRDGRWKAAYASQRTITIPRDLRAALAARPRAKEFFQALTARTAMRSSTDCTTPSRRRRANGGPGSSFRCWRRARLCMSRQPAHAAA